MRNCKEYEYPKWLSFPIAALVVEEAKSVFVKGLWGHGLAANGNVLKKFMVRRPPGLYPDAAVDGRSVLVGEWSGRGSREEGVWRGRCVILLPESHICASSFDAHTRVGSRRTREQ